MIVGRRNLRTSGGRVIYNITTTIKKKNDFILSIKSLLVDLKKVLDV